MGKSYAERLIAEVLDWTTVLEATAPRFGERLTMPRDRAQAIRQIAIAAQQERAEGQEGAAGCAALDSSPKAPDEAGNRPSVDAGPDPALTCLLGLIDERATSMPHGLQRLSVLIALQEAYRRVADLSR